MDHQTTTSQRVRPILRAMERSIDEARRKRGGSEQGSGTNNIARPNTSSFTSAPSTSATPASPMAIHQTSQPTAPAVRPPSSAAPTSQNSPHTFGSYATPINQSNDGDNADQPVRLKAKPKRWQSASA